MYFMMHSKAYIKSSARFLRFMHIFALCSSLIVDMKDFVMDTRKIICAVAVLQHVLLRFFGSYNFDQVYAGCKNCGSWKKMLNRLKKLESTFFLC